MGRATIADIAANAGVSSATVDRALNGRRGVSALNRHRVIKAARDLGYVASEGMVILPSRPVRLEFLIPLGQNAFMHDVLNSIVTFAKDQPLVESCNVIPLDGIGPDALSSGLDRVSVGTEGVGVITTDHPRSRDAIRRLCESGVRVVTLASDVSATPRSAYVGVDNHISGRTAGQILGMLAGEREGTVALFLGSRAFNGHQEREFGFRAYMAENKSNFRVLPSFETGEDSRRLRIEMAKLLRYEPNLLGVYCVGAGRKGIIEALDAHSNAVRPYVVLHDLTKSSRAWLVDGRIDAVIDQNAQLVGEQAVLRLLGAIASNASILPLHHIEPRIILSENVPARELT